jgi:hypothetical protein
MERTSLVLMAAGLGSRFGSTKQLAKIGPNGETILDYTIKDAISAGLERIVIVVRKEIMTDVETHLAQIHGKDHGYIFVCQDEFGPKRSKPWGTTHAVITAAEVIDRNSTFILANADDYYGPKSFEVAVTQLPNLSEQLGMLITFELAKTLPKAGEVSRGICQVVDSELVEIIETARIETQPDGNITDLTDGTRFRGDTPVSMNLWGFHGSVMGHLLEKWEQFLSRNATSEDAECLLPISIGNLMNDGIITISAVPSSETWTGLTNPEDHKTVRQIIKVLRH